MRNFAFVQVDVFTSRPFEGNQLAVITDASGLETEQMQEIAREMNLSETTFVLPRAFNEGRDGGHQVRIFTVNEELPFAGHPTLGTAWVLRLTSGAPEVWLDLKVGSVIPSSAPCIRQRKLREFSAFRPMNSTPICPSRQSLPAFHSPWFHSAPYGRCRRYTQTGPL
jgi:PhzF family phenazine biosynthesis protein